MIRLHQNLNTPTITIFSIYYTVPNLQYRYLTTHDFSLNGSACHDIVFLHLYKIILIIIIYTFTSCDCPLCRNWPGRRGGTAQANSYWFLPKSHTISHNLSNSIQTKWMRTFFSFLYTIILFITSLRLFH